MATPTIRSSSLEFLRNRAEQAHAEAKVATLDHVRERCQRSEAAWLALVDHAEHRERMRIAEAEQKALQARQH